MNDFLNQVKITSSGLLASIAGIRSTNKVDFSSSIGLQILDLEKDALSLFTISQAILSPEAQHKLHSKFVDLITRKEALDLIDEYLESLKTWSDVDIFEESNHGN